MLVSTTCQKGRSPPTKEATDHFEKLFEAPYLNHSYSVQHAYKDCGLLRKFLSKEDRLGRGQDRTPKGR